MENAAGTAEHLARLAQRRAALGAAVADIFRPPARFVWEIGCGHGHFLAAYAQAHPTLLCLGLDVVLERIKRAIRKRDRARLGNLHFLQAEAQMFLDVLPSAAELAAVYVLFPDPWPKLRHHKHRLMQPDFLTAMAGRAGKGTPLYFRTDHEEYFMQVEALLRAHPAWRLVEEPWTFEAPTVFQARAPSYRSLVAARR